LLYFNNTRNLRIIKKLFELSPLMSRVGMYKLRLCLNGYWQTVILDDYFPCYASEAGGPVYCKNHDNELWVLLVEKAFAKHYGNYSRLRSGWCYEAMIDLTGAPFKTIRLSDEDVTVEIERGTLWTKLLGYDRSGYMITAVTPGEDIFSEGGERHGPEIKKGPSGLIGGHAYTVLTVAETSKGHKLMKIRNPWGRFEWLGDWSDNSPCWNDELRQELDADDVVDDGIFWMSFDDCCKYFFSINVCMTKTETGVIPFYELRRRTFFVFNKEMENSQLIPPMYSMTLNAVTKVFVSLHQQDVRQQSAPPYVDIGVTVLKLQPDYTFALISASGLCVERQVQAEMLLSPGHYIIVPITSGCKYDQYCGEVGNLYYDANRFSVAQEISSKKLLDMARSKFTRDAENAFREIFSRLDEDLDGVSGIMKYLLKIIFVCV
jgi:calpain-15